MFPPSRRTEINWRYWAWFLLLQRLNGQAERDTG
jgi:hypothetical protein